MVAEPYKNVSVGLWWLCTACGCGVARRLTTFYLIVARNQLKKCSSSHGPSSYWQLFCRSSAGLFWCGLLSRGQSCGDVGVWECVTLESVILLLLPLLGSPLVALCRICVNFCRPETLLAWRETACRFGGLVWSCCLDSHPGSSMQHHVVLGSACPLET